MLAPTKRFFSEMQLVNLIYFDKVNNNHEHGRQCCYHQTVFVFFFLSFCLWITSVFFFFSFCLFLSFSTYLSLYSQFCITVCIFVRYFYPYKSFTLTVNVWLCNSIFLFFILLSSYYLFSQSTTKSCFLRSFILLISFSFIMFLFWLMIC